MALKHHKDAVMAARRRTALGIHDFVKGGIFAKVLCDILCNCCILHLGYISVEHCCSPGFGLQLKKELPWWCLPHTNVMSVRRSQSYPSDHCTYSSALQLSPRQTVSVQTMRGRPFFSTASTLWKAWRTSYCAWILCWLWDNGWCVCRDSKLLQCKEYFGL